MNDTYVTICGNATADPLTRTTSKGEPMVKIRLASTPWRYDSDQRRYVDMPTNFVDVLAFRHLARHVQASVSKGDPLVVHGRLRVVPWERDGRTGTNVEIEASTIGHDMNRGVAAFTRANQAEPARQEAPAYPTPDPAAADTDEYVVHSA